MTITYRSSRREVSGLYWFLWRRSAKLKLYQVFIATCAFMTAWLYQAPTAASPATRGLIAAAFTLVVLALLPLYPLAMFKPQERRLTIDEQGIETSIGAQHGKVPWSQVAEIVSRGETIYIVGKNFNAFVIPMRAFSTPEQREEFEKLAMESFLRACS